MRAFQKASDVLFLAVLVLVPNEVMTCYRNCTCEVEGSALTLECSRHVPRSVLSVVSDKYTEVTLLSVDIKTLDFNTFDQLHHLVNFTLRSSSLSKVKGTGRNFQALESLDLSNNNIAVLEDHAFRDFPKLIVLILSGNHIHSISSVAFSLKNLQALDLTKNNIKQLHTFALSGMPHLRWINISENGLTHIPNGLFGALNSIETVDFSSNKITKIADKAFEGINFTRVLNLKRNYLKTFPTRAMQDVVYINELIMDENEITALDSHAVNKIPLRILEMKNMKKLKYIKADAFGKMPTLEAIRISGCPSLQTIHHRAFTNLSNLVALDISNNAIQILPESLILNTPGLKDIDVSGNNFSCHCSMLWTLGNSIITEKPVCTKNNEIISIPDSQSSKPCPPLIIPWSDKEVLVPVGNNVVLNCEAISIQPGGINITWKGPGGIDIHHCDKKKVLPSAPCLSGDELVIHFTAEKNEGNYTCSAVDEMNQSSDYSIWLRVQKDAVKIYAIEISSKTFSVSWNPPDFGQKLQNGFVIETVDMQNGVGVRNRSFERTYNSHVCKLTGLSPNRLYNVSLTVYEGEERLILSSIVIHTQNDTRDEVSQTLRHGHLLLVIASGSLALAMTITLGCFARILYMHMRQKKATTVTESKSTDSNIYLVTDDKLSSRVSPSYSFVEIMDQSYTDIDISDLDRSPLVI